MATLEQAIAARRFGLGARPTDLERDPDPRAALTARLDDPARYALDPGLPSLADAVGVVDALREARAAGEKAPGGAEPGSTSGEPAAPAEPVEAGKKIAEVVGPDLEARLRRALTTSDGFAERLVWFWSNHFTVAATKAACAPFVGLFEREVVRGHLAGTFEDLLLASSRHPAMLLYLDQARSAGPDSRIGKARELGLNENLAREILELHTLGVRGGYTQDDVLELARAMTGFTVMRSPFRRFGLDAPDGAYVWADVMHQPGARTVLGRSWPEGGEEQPVGLLKSLAHHPSTARHVATKLARHFVADEPPAELVASLEQAFLSSGGHLPTVHRALVEHDAAWVPEARKLTTPTEFLVSALRATEQSPEPRAVVAVLRTLGQPTWRAASPAGWPDTAADWSGPDALMKRVEWSQRLAVGVGSRARPEAWLRDVLGPLATERTLTAVSRAASGAQGIVLGLMSPEFQRR